MSKEDALSYHSRGRHGKIEVHSTKACQTQEDLSLAYTPGVEWPVRAIAENEQNSYKYTVRGNLVGVISNGTAILGMGSLGALASKPVMEGKVMLFKRFADIDVFDIEIDSTDPEDIINVCRLIQPTFGGINLEDIKAPECFRIEQELKRILDIPVFHDDQHGTAIIAGAGLINALEIAGKNIENVSIVVNGAGAAGIACARFSLLLGAKQENILMCDSRGVIYTGRFGDMSEEKRFFAADTKRRTLTDALAGADVFIGVSVAGAMTPDMLRSMAVRPIVFAMANPNPEIKYDTAKSIRDDVIIATGRSDFPNQVNNVLGFPFIFRGALDVMATTINDEMKLACAGALADLAKKPVPEEVCRAYGGETFSFGPNYIIPKPFDPRALPEVSWAVARAAMMAGVARQLLDLDHYKEKLRALSVRLNDLPEDFPFD
ncbi:MAG: malate dehydrogenase [Deltaproteobacteria bacterium]|nr:malate dehydrogenase [Candidatus Zymogenaceae bacterium]